MNRQEVTVLARLIAAYCPAQKFDEFTPDAMYDLLNDLRFEDAKLAAIEVAKEQPFVSSSEIRAKVKAIRSDRIRAAEPIIPPPSLPDAEYSQWYRDELKRIGDGGDVQPLAQLPKRPIEVIEGTFQRIPDRS